MISCEVGLNATPNHASSSLALLSVVPEPDTVPPVVSGVMVVFSLTVKLPTSLASKLTNSSPAPELLSISVTVA